MAQSGYTPIQIYSSSTASTAPSASNLLNNTLGSEIAINITDGKLYYKDNAGAVQVIASKASALATVSSVAMSVPSFLSVSGSPITTSGTLAVTLSGTALPTANGGTGLTSFTSGGAVYATSTSVLTTGTLPITAGGTGQTTASAAFNGLSPITTTGDLIVGNGTNSATRLAIGTSGYVLTSNGTTATWAAASGGVTTISFGTTGLTPSTATSGAVSVAGTLNVSNGGTGATTLTGLAYGNGTSAFTAATSAQVLSVIGTTASVQFGSFGVGTAASGTSGEIRATNNVTAYYSSDRRLKENIQDVDNALDKVCAIGSKTFDWIDEYITSKGGEDGYFVQKSDFGVVAQDVQEVFPQAVRTRQDGTLAVDYEKLATLAFGAIKELVKRVEALETKS